ncbi:hypothetical protein CH063_10627, partial [Colletotrichum higginsianum]
EMGLGKTLSILSLICWSIDSINNDKAKDNNEQSSSTLIVTPKSGTYTQTKSESPSTMALVDRSWGRTFETTISS